MREEAALTANINATFGLRIQETRQSLSRTGAQAISDNELAELAGDFSLYVLSMLEFSNQEGRPLIFEGNTDERILAICMELRQQQTRERLFVWEASPELKKAEAKK